MPKPNDLTAHELLTTNRKALVINLDAKVYGTFAEIGAGQEVARHFFHAGAAAGTVAKTISAYDMTFSDAIYGRCKRYVSRERLQTMLEHEYLLLRERLSEARGENSRFFVFADTVAATSYLGTNESHGWLGVRFQRAPMTEPNDVVAHVRMRDRENLAQQQALGIFGVNLLYAACYLHTDPAAFIRSLADNLTTERIEVDLIHFSGPDYGKTDNRLLALQLVQEGFTHAAIFGPDGVARLPSTAIRKKAVLVQRGNFKPVTKVGTDLMAGAMRKFAAEREVAGKEILSIYELNVSKLQTGNGIDPHDFLARVDSLAALGAHVVVSNYYEYFRLTHYFRRYTSEMVGFAMGARNLALILDEKFYEHLEGGILEAFGRLFKSNVRLYVYPQQETADDGSTRLVTAPTIEVPPSVRHLLAHVMENGLVEPITDFNPAVLEVFSRDALQAIRAGDPAWETMVPEPSVAVIKAKKLFGLKN